MAADESESDANRKQATRNKRLEAECKLQSDRLEEQLLVPAASRTRKCAGQLVEATGGGGECGRASDASGA